MYKCDLCNKIFEYRSYLDRHKSKKISCILKKECIKCISCNLEFNYKSLLERHEKSKRHIMNINSANVHIGDVNNITNNNTNNTYNINNINNNIHLTLQTNGFSETSLECLRESVFESYLFDDHIANCLTQLKDNDIISKRSIINNSFKMIIELFKILNFNLVYEKNHNCKIFLFSKSALTNHIEYHLLEIDNEKKQYKLKFVKYDIFIEELLKLMNRVNAKFKNLDFDLLLTYINSNKKLIIDDEIKSNIENKLINIYNSFIESKDNITNEALMQNVINERKRLL